MRKTCSVRFPSGSGVRVRCRIRSSDPKSCRERLSKRGDAIQFWVEVRDRRVTHTRRTRPTRASVDASRDRSRPRGRRRGDGRTVSTGSRCAPTRDAPFSAAVIISTNSSGAAPCCSAPVATAGTSFGSSPQLNSRPMPATDGMVEVCLVASNATARSAESRANPRIETSTAHGAGGFLFGRAKARVATSTGWTRREKNKSSG